MAIVFGTTTIGAGNRVYFNNEQMKKVFYNGTLVYQYDSTAPSVSVDTWSSSSSSPTVINYSPATVAATVTDSESGVASVTINGVSVSKGSDGKYSRSIDLTNNATNTITVVATDNAGNTTTAYRYIYSDRSAPSLTLYYSSYTEGSSASLRAVASDGGSGISRIVMNGGTYYTTDQTVTVSLGEGWNSFTVYAYDNAGNSTASTASIKRYPYRSSTVTVSGTMEGRGAAGSAWWYILYRWNSASASINSNYNVTSYSPTSSDSREILSMGTPEQHFYATQSISYSNHTFTVSEARASQDTSTDSPIETKSWSITITYYYYDHS